MSEINFISGWTCLTSIPRLKKASINIWSYFAGVYGWIGDGPLYKSANFFELPNCNMFKGTATLYAGEIGIKGFKWTNITFLD